MGPNACVCVELPCPQRSAIGGSVVIVVTTRSQPARRTCWQMAQPQPQPQGLAGTADCTHSSTGDVYIVSVGMPHLNAACCMHCVFCVNAEAASTEHAVVFTAGTGACRQPFTHRANMSTMGMATPHRDQFRPQGGGGARAAAKPGSIASQALPVSTTRARAKVQVWSAGQHASSEEYATPSIRG